MPQAVQMRFLVKKGSDAVGSPWKPLALAAQDPLSNDNPLSSSPRGSILYEALDYVIASGMSSVMMDTMPMVSVMPKKIFDRSQSSIAKMLTRLFVGAQQCPWICHGECCAYQRLPSKSNLSNSPGRYTPLSLDATRHCLIS